jgi:hypothetical protein
MKGIIMTEETTLRRLVGDIFATRDDEVQCREAANLIARCSDALLTDAEVRQRYPQLWHHFTLCSDCAREYLAVMALARNEAEDHLSQINPTPPVPAETEAPLQETEGTHALLFVGFSPAAAAAVTRGEEQVVEPVTVTFPDDDVRITLDVAPAAVDPQHRDLYCTVATPEGYTPEGASIWLQTSEQQTVVAEQTLDDLGDALFEAIAPGTYDLRLYLAGKEYRIAQIDIP